MKKENMVTKEIFVVEKEKQVTSTEQSIQAMRRKFNIEKNVFMKKLLNKEKVIIEREMKCAKTINQIGDIHSENINKLTAHKDKIVENLDELKNKEALLLQLSRENEQYKKDYHIMQQELDKLNRQNADFLNKIEQSRKELEVRETQLKEKEKFLLHREMEIEKNKFAVKPDDLDIDKQLDLLRIQMSIVNTTDKLVSKSVNNVKITTKTIQ